MKEIDTYLNSDVRDAGSDVNEIYSPMYTGKMKIEFDETQIFKKRTFVGLIQIDDD